jgi:APA family basic amino acid/polyamine antiporter
MSERTNGREALPSGPGSTADGIPAGEGGSTGRLERRLGLFPLTNIVVANMVGAGIFTTSGLLLRDLGSPLLLLVLWAVGGVIALCGAVCYGELGAAMPHAGGEYFFLSRLYHPLPGFLSGWVSLFVGFSAPIAASAIGFSEYISRAFPGLLGLHLGAVTPSASLLKKIYAALVIIAFSLLHRRGIKLGARVQNLLTTLKIVLIVGLIGLGFASGAGSLGHLAQGRSILGSFGGWKSAGLGLMWIMFAYSGWNASAYIGSEVKEPRRNLPRSLLLGTGIVILLYVLLNLLFVYAVPPREMSGVIAVGGLAAGRLFGPAVDGVFSVLIAFALFSSLSAFIILGPRVYYSMAKDGMFFRFLADVHARFRVPAKSIALQGLMAVIIALSGSFDQILTYMGFSLGIFPLLAVAGVFKLRRTNPSGLRMPGAPLAAVVYLLAGGLILVLGFLRAPGPSLVAVLTAAAGVPAFYYFKARQSARPGPAAQAVGADLPEER